MTRTAKQTAYIALPTLADTKVGDTVSGHWAQGDRTGTVTQIKGEKALVSFTIQDGSPRQQWVRSRAPVTAAEGAKSDKSQASRALRSAASWLAGSRAQTARAVALQSAAQRGEVPVSDRERYVRADADAGRAHLLAALARTGAGTLRGGVIYFTPTAETALAEALDHTEQCRGVEREAGEQYATARTNALRVGLSLAQIEAAAAKGQADAQRSYGWMTA